MLAAIIGRGHITSLFAPELHPHTSRFPGRERGKMVSERGVSEMGEPGSPSITIGGSKASWRRRSPPYTASSAVPDSRGLP